MEQHLRDTQNAAKAASAASSRAKKVGQFRIRKTRLFAPSSCVCLELPNLISLLAASSDEQVCMKDRRKAYKSGDFIVQQKTNLAREQRQEARP